MNKQEYLHELEKALRAGHVQDTEDILEEYQAHFTFKQKDGFTEEEITAKLAKPKDIAAQYTQIAPDKKAGGGRALLAAGLVLLDTVTVMLGITLFAGVLVLGATAIACGGLGICLITTIKIAGLIPYMPYLGALLLGIGLLGFAALTAVGTMYCYMYLAQLSRVYRHWHKRVYTGAIAPTLPKYPQINEKTRRRMRNLALISMILCVAGVLIGFLVLFIYAEFNAFWHYWNWFQ